MLLPHDSRKSVAKKAFSQINNKEAFLQAAFKLIALQKNAESKTEDMQILLKLCQDNLESGKLFVEVLSEENPTLFNQLAMALANDKTSGGELLDQLLCWSVQLGSLRTDRWEPDQCKQLADTLLSAGDTGAIQLARLLVGDKLLELKQDGDQCKALISALIKADSIYFPMLILYNRFSQLENFKLDENQRDKLVDITIRKAPAWLKLLLNREELANFTLGKNRCYALAIALTRNEDGGVELLKRLLEEKDNKLKTNEWSTYQCNQLAMELAGNENGGVELLKKLLGEDKLPQFQLWGYSDCTTSKTRALELLNSVENGIAELKSLIGTGDEHEGETPQPFILAIEFLYPCNASKLLGEAREFL